MARKIKNIQLVEFSDTQGVEKVRFVHPVMEFQPNSGFYPEWTKAQLLDQTNVNLTALENNIRLFTLLSGFTPGTAEWVDALEGFERKGKKFKTNVGDYQLDGDHPNGVAWASSDGLDWSFPVKPASGGDTIIINMGVDELGYMDPPVDPEGAIANIQVWLYMAGYTNLAPAIIQEIFDTEFWV